MRLGILGEAFVLRVRAHSAHPAPLQYGVRHRRRIGRGAAPLEREVGGEARQRLFEDVGVGGVVQADVPCARRAVACAVTQADLGVCLEVVGGVFGPRVGAHV